MGSHADREIVLRMEDVGPPSTFEFTWTDSMGRLHSTTAVQSLPAAPPAQPPHHARAANFPGSPYENPNQRLAEHFLGEVRHVEGSEQSWLPHGQLNGQVKSGEEGRGQGGHFDGPQLEKDVLLSSQTRNGATRPGREFETFGNNSRGRGVISANANDPFPRSLSRSLSGGRLDFADFAENKAQTASANEVDPHVMEEQDRLYALWLLEKELGLDDTQLQGASNSFRVRQRVNSIGHNATANLDLRTNSGHLLGEDELSLQHARLAETLFFYGLKEHQMAGDGNCQFRSLSDQLFGTPDRHAAVRRAVVNHMKLHRAWYKDYVAEDFNSYLKAMSKNGEWGDNVTLQAAANHYGVRISLVTSFKDKPLVEILPRGHKPNREIWLSFFAEVHYNSIYPVEDYTPRRKAWSIGNPFMSLLGI